MPAKNPSLRTSHPCLSAENGFLFKKILGYSMTFSVKLLLAAEKLKFCNRARLHRLLKKRGPVVFSAFRSKSYLGGQLAHSHG
jgi:hypothetical protein